MTQENPDSLGKTHYYGDDCDPPHVCPRCDGHGYTVHRINPLSVRDRRREERDCPECRNVSDIPTQQEEP
jgi:hypothetical protein